MSHFYVNDYRTISILNCSAVGNKQGTYFKFWSNLIQIKIKCNHFSFISKHFLFCSTISGNYLFWIKIFIFTKNIKSWRCDICLGPCSTTVLHYTVMLFCHFTFKKWHLLWFALGHFGDWLCSASKYPVFSNFLWNFLQPVILMLLTLFGWIQSLFTLRNNRNVLELIFEKRGDKHIKHTLSRFLLTQQPW